MGRRLVALCSAFALAASLAWAQGDALRVQMEMRVPFAPTAFPSGEQNLLFYELYLTNFTRSALAIQRIEILDAASAA